MEKRKLGRIFVAGHGGLVGRNLVKILENRNYDHLLLCSRAQLNLLDTSAVDRFFAKEEPNTVIVAAAKVGGIHANNTLRADFIFENLAIQNNLIWGAHKNGVENLVFLGSSCIYPRMAPQPIAEESLLTGPLELTNRPYAVAKIAGLELINGLRYQYGRSYFSVMPTNLYGPGDNFTGAGSHVIPALIKKFYHAVKNDEPQVSVWGSGNALREFMHAEDCADAIVTLLETPGERFNRLMGDGSWFHINVGSGEELSIATLANLIAKKFSYSGKIHFDKTYPDGTPRKLLDCSLLQKFGWKSRIKIEDGLSQTIDWFLQAMNEINRQVRL